MEEILKTIEELKQARRTWEFPSFDEETAWLIGTRIREKAKEKAIPLPYPHMEQKASFLLFHAGGCGHQRPVDQEKGEHRISVPEILL